MFNTFHAKFTRLCFDIGGPRETIAIKSSYYRLDVGLLLWHLWEQCNTDTVACLSLALVACCFALVNLSNLPLHVEPTVSGGMYRSENVRMGTSVFKKYGTSIFTFAEKSTSIFISADVFYGIDGTMLCELFAYSRDVSLFTFSPF